MADQGPLIRVDIGRGHLIKMTPAQAAKWRAEHGIVEVPVVPPEIEVVTTTEEIELGSMTVPALREFAEERGIDLQGATRKDDIIEAIEAGSGDVAADDED